MLCAEYKSGQSPTNKAHCNIFSNAHGKPFRLELVLSVHNTNEKQIHNFISIPVMINPNRICNVNASTGLELEQEICT